MGLALHHQSPTFISAINQQQYHMACTTTKLADRDWGLGLRFSTLMNCSKTFKLFPNVLLFTAPGRYILFKVFNGYTFSWANINVEVANVCAAMDTLIDQDGVSLTPPRPYIHQCILSNNYIPYGLYVLLHMINTWNVLYHLDLFWNYVVKCSMECTFCCIW